jgi:hypothetical protein
MHNQTGNVAQPVGIVTWCSATWHPWLPIRLSLASIFNHLRTQPVWQPYCLFPLCRSNTQAFHDDTNEENQVFLKTINKVHASSKSARGRQLLSLLVALIFALVIYPGKAHAQVVGGLRVDIPFQFHAGNAKLPPGEYIIHVLDDSDLTVMEISSVDGSTSALFQVQETEANASPAKSELIFNKYGNRYFLARVFDEGNPSGSKVVESRYEKRISQTATAAQEHLPAHHQGQQGS